MLDQTSFVQDVARLEFLSIPEGVNKWLRSGEGHEEDLVDKGGSVMSNNVQEYWRSCILRVVS